MTIGTKKTPWKIIIARILTAHFSVTLIFLFGLLLFRMIVLGLTFEGAQKLNSYERPAAEAVLSIFAYLGIGAVITAFIFALFKRWDKRPISELGLNFQRSVVSDLFFGLFVGLLPSVISFSILSAMGIEMRGSITALPNITLSHFLLFVTILALVAWYEELVFRGYITANLLERLRPVKVILISALLFALAHLQSLRSETLLDVPGLFFAGILLGLAFFYKKNLWLPVGIHFGNNFTTIFLLRYTPSPATHAVDTASILIVVFLALYFMQLKRVDRVNLK